jgi:RNA polymerase sigma-54 factor
MQKSLRILQMTSQEVQDILTIELNDNPFLEILEEPSQTLDSETKEKSETEDYESTESNETDIVDGNMLDKSEEEYLHYERVTTREDFDNNFDQVAGEKKTLRDILIEQINLTITTPKHRVMAVYITDLLDSNAYLKEPIEAISSQLKCTTEEIEEVLRLLHSFEPAGAYARDLSECLTIQLKDKGIFNDKYRTLVANLELIAAREIKKLARLCKTEVEIIYDMIEVIKSLDPKPGRNYDTERERAIIPDAIVYREGDGLKLRLNSNLFWHTKVNNEYFNRTITLTKNEQEKKFCTEKLKYANWLTSVMEKRAKAILRVAEQIVCNQYEFFTYGVNYLKPMTLRSVAESLGVHESTISRVSNKILATPFGNYEMKYFFTNALNSPVFAEQISTSSAKNRIKQIIENEPANQTFSDEQISQLLHAQGIEISRRTVTKYREGMAIPTSSQRKRNKQYNVK